MRPKTNRLLILLLGVAIAGCANQTDRSSSGGGAQAEVAAKPAPDAAPAVEPEKESVQFIDRPLDETPPPKPVPVAAAAKDESTPEFPITKYELPEDQAKDEEVEDLGPQEDNSVSAEQEALPAEESSVGETTEYADDQQEEADSGEVEDLGPQTDESGTVSYPEEERAGAEIVVGEPKVYEDEPATQAAPTPPQEPAPVTSKSISVNFETEPLFSFDKSDVRGDQRAKLDEFVSGLAGTEYDSIAIVGHADRIGKEDYNQKLSERRAEAVKAYLVRKGVPDDKIQTEGRGMTDSVTGDACNKVRGKTLISCLQPDRRVDVSVSATKQSN